MRYIYTNQAFSYRKEVEILPHFPADYNTGADEIDEDTGDTYDNMMTSVTNNIARMVNTELLIKAVGFQLKKSGLPLYMAYRTQPVLDVSLSFNCMITPLTNIVRDDEEDAKRGITEDRVFPDVFFTVYDIYGGLPTVSIPVWSLPSYTFQSYLDDEKCAEDFLQIWLEKVIEKFGDEETFAKAFFKPEFSNQPLEDAYVIYTGRFIDDKLPVNAYDGDETLAREKAENDLRNLSNRFHNIKKTEVEEWERFNKIAKEKEDSRKQEYAAMLSEIMSKKKFRK